MTKYAKRKAGLVACALAVFTIAALPVPAAEVEGPRVFWKFSTHGAPRDLTRGFEVLAKRLAEKTDGNFELRIFFGQQLSNTAENIDGLKVGAFEGATVCNIYHPGKTPALMVMSLPYMPVETWEREVALRHAVYDHPVIQQELGAWDVMAYTSTFSMPNEVIGRGKPPASVEDWKGIRVRAGGGAGEALKEMGAEPQTIPSTDLYAALQRGLMDAAAMPIYSFDQQKFFEVTDWYTKNFRLGIGDCAISFKKSAYEALPPQYQQLLMDLRPEVVDVYRADREASVERVFPFMESQGKIAVEFTDEQLRAFEEASKAPVWDRWLSENAGKFDAQKLLDDVIAAATAIQ